MQALASSQREPAKGALLGFFALTFAMAWTCWIAATALSRGSGPMPPVLAGLRPLFLLGTFAPGLIALALTARAGGLARVQALLGRILQWQVGARWYMFAAGYLAAIKLAVALLHRLATGAWPRFGQTPWYVMLLAIPVSTWVQAGEEVG